MRPPAIWIERPWRWPAMAAALIAAAALGGCAGTGTVEQTEQPQLVLNEPVQPLPPPPVASAPVREQRFPVPKKKPAASGAKPAAEAKAEPQPIGPERIVGLTEAQTADLLGRPAEQEEKAPARLWRYGARDCTATIIFYPEVESLTYRVLDIEIVNREGRETTDRACLGEIAAARSSRG
mgnify:CR=1 FL=1